MEGWYTGTKEEWDKDVDTIKENRESVRRWRDAPEYYKFPGGIETGQISSHLNSLGGQALQYVARSTRLDGRNKERDPRESLRKAIDLILMEIDRLDEEFGDKA